MDGGELIIAGGRQQNLTTRGGQQSGHAEYRNFHDREHGWDGESGNPPGKQRRWADGPMGRWADGPRIRLIARLFTKLPRQFPT